MLVYAISDRKSFDHLNALREKAIRAKDTEDLPLVIVGNKCDLPPQARQVPLEDAEKKVRLISAQYLAINIYLYYS
jgi:GTPase SAR1 family protein